MPKPRDRQALLDMHTSAELAIKYLTGKTYKEFLIDSVIQDAVIRRLEIIGEASRRLTQASIDILPQVPWHSWVAFRNRLSHAYDDVDLSIVGTQLLMSYLC